jgi:hypothetical protein
VFVGRGSAPNASGCLEYVDDADEFQDHQDEKHRADNTQRITAGNLRLDVLVQHGDLGIAECGKPGGNIGWLMSSILASRSLAAIVSAVVTTPALATGTKPSVMIPTDTMQKTSVFILSALIVFPLRDWCALSVYITDTVQFITILFQSIAGDEMD